MPDLGFNTNLGAVASVDAIGNPLGFPNVTSPPAITPNTVAPPNFSFGFPAPQPFAMTPMEQAIQNQLNMQIDPNMQTINPQPTPFSPPETPQIDPNMQAPKSVPTPPLALPMAFQQVESLEQDLDPNDPLNQTPPQITIPVTPPMFNFDKEMEVDPNTLMGITPQISPTPAQKGFTQQASLQDISLAPPQGYMDAFNAPMTMAEALNATLAAMNPSMTAPSADEGAPSADEGAPSGQSGIGSDAAASASVGDSGEDGGTSSSGTSGIGSEGGGGAGPSGTGASGTAAGAAGTGPGGPGGPGEGGSEGGGAGV